MKLKDIVNSIKSLWDNVSSLKSVNILKAIIPEDFDLTATEDYQYIPVSLQEDIKTGTKLSFSNDKIIVGAGVESVKLTANCIIRNSTDTDLFGLVIRKNDTNYVMSYSQIATAEYGNLSIPSTVCPVEQGDELSLAVYLNHTNNKCVMRQYTRSTFLEVDVINS